MTTDSVGTASDRPADRRHLISAVSRRRVVSPTLVGRDAELAAMVAAVQAPPAVVTLRGDAGLGKTRLVTELANHPELSGHTWAVGACRRIREPFPLGPVIEAVRGLGERLGAAELSPVAGALRPLLPELSPWLPPPLEPLEDRAGERHRLFRGIVDVFSSLGPVVLVLEDLHWADVQTPELVGYLLADPPSQLSLVLTFRGGEIATGAPSETAGLAANVSRTDITLAPLDEEQARTLTATILGQQQISPEFGAYIWDRTSGVPFAVEELVALLQARGALVRRPDGWVRRTLDQLDVPAGIRAQVLERVGVLSDGARAMVEAAAVLQSPAPATVLRATCRAPGDVPGLDEALHAGVLVTEDGLIGFRHLLAARAVYEGIPEPGRQELHSRAVTALEALDPVPLGKLAHHLRHAGRLDEWAVAAERAADQATELGHDEEAARLLEDVLREAPLDGPRRGRLATKLARAAIETLHITEELTSLLSGVLDDDLPATTRGELRFRLALLLEAAGADPLRVRELYLAAASELDERPDLKAWAMMGLGIHTATGVPLAEHREWVQRVLEILPAVEPPPFQTFLLGKATMELVTIGDPAGRELIARLEAQTGSAPRNRHQVNAYQSVGMAACYAGHHPVADRLLTLALESPVTRENRKLELRVRAALALLDYGRGRWDGLGDTVATLLEELADYPLARVDTEVVAGCLALAHGEVSLSRRRLTRVAAEVMEMGGYDLVALAVGALARLAAENGADAEGGDTDAGHSVLEFLAAARAKGFWLPVARALPSLVQLFVASGQRDEAELLLDECAREVAGLDAPLAGATVPHAQGWLHAGADSARDAGEQFLAAAVQYDAAGCPYESAQAREQAGRCLLDAGDDIGADPLATALRTYLQLGASWDRDRAARTARRHGVPVPALHRGGRHGYHDELSPRERDVVALVATGQTNKEIARELYVSPKTVEKHVSAALRKLGLRSRTALARHYEATLRNDDRGWGDHPIATPESS